MVTGNDNKTQENRDYKVMKDPVTLWSSLRPSFVHSVSPIHTLRERTKRADGARFRRPKRGEERGEGHGNGTEATRERRVRRK